jgi:7-carboxy-7-deazaguanine synthase
MEGLLPIAEIFESIQGEGTYVGTPMLFVRLAGCNVGKPAKALKEQPFPILSSGREAMACTTYDGRVFPCDTDYSLTSKVPIKDVIAGLMYSGLKHVCVTGGEPFLHAELINDLWNELSRHDVQIHVETSGTIMPKRLFGELMCPGWWITCSPKLMALGPMIRRADELKILVDEDFEEHKLSIDMIEHPNVFLCPVNDVDDLKPENVQRCVDLLKKYPRWRVSIQTHKLFHWR